MCIHSMVGPRPYSCSRKLADDVQYMHALASSSAAQHASSRSSSSSSPALPRRRCGLRWNMEWTTSYKRVSVIMQSDAKDLTNVPEVSKYIKEMQRREHLAAGKLQMVRIRNFFQFHDFTQNKDFSRLASNLEHMNWNMWDNSQSHLGAEVMLN